MDNYISVLRVVKSGKTQDGKDMFKHISVIHSGQYEIDHDFYLTISHAPGDYAPSLRRKLVQVDGKYKAFPVFTIGESI